MIKKVSQEQNNYGFYSKVLKKPYDSLEELRQAEEQYTAELRAKEEAAALRRAEAAKVEEAYKALNAAKRAYKQATEKAFSTYLSAVELAQQTYSKANAEAAAELNAAEEAYGSALNEFTAKHPEGFHITLKDGDYETVLASKSADAMSSRAVVDFSDLFNTINRMFFK